MRLCERHNKMKSNIPKEVFEVMALNIIDHIGYKSYLTKYDSGFRIDELLEVVNIAKSGIGKDRTLLDEEGRISIGYIDNNNQTIEVLIPINGLQTSVGPQFYS
jgi:hypothetical protein